MERSDDRRPERKPYRHPALVSYGDLARITNTVGSNGMKDGGMKPNGRSQP